VSGSAPTFVKCFYRSKYFAPLINDICITGNRYFAFKATNAVVTVGGNDSSIFFSCAFLSVNAVTREPRNFA